MKFLKPLQNGGTQPKWYDSKTDSFLKADDKKSYGGCEGLAETICSDLVNYPDLSYRLEVGSPLFTALLKALTQEKEKEIEYER